MGRIVFGDHPVLHTMFLGPQHCSQVSEEGMEAQVPMAVKWRSQDSNPDSKVHVIISYAIGGSIS